MPLLLRSRRGNEFRSRLLINFCLFGNIDCNSRQRIRHITDGITMAEEVCLSVLNLSVYVNKASPVNGHQEAADVLSLFFPNLSYFSFKSKVTKLAHQLTYESFSSFSTGERSERVLPVLSPKSKIIDTLSCFFFLFDKLVYMSDDNQCIPVLCLNIQFARWQRMELV